MTEPYQDLSDALNTSFETKNEIVKNKKEIKEQNS